MKRLIYLVALVLLIGSVTAENLTECETELEDYKDQYSDCKDERSDYRDDFHACEENLSVTTLFYQDCQASAEDSNVLQEENLNLRTEINQTRDTILELRLAADGLKDNASNIEYEIEMLRGEKLNFDKKLEKCNNATRACIWELEEYKGKEDYGCPNAAVAFKTYFDGWVRLNPLTKNCLRTIMAQDVINPLEIPQLCDIPLKETSFGYPVFPDEAEIILNDLVNYGFADLEGNYLRPIKIGSGCIYMFEKAKTEESHTFLDSVIVAIIIFIALDSTTHFVSKKIKKKMEESDGVKRT